MSQSSMRTSTVSCVYDLLQSDNASIWSDNGDIAIKRPTVNVDLNCVKFRSFSANIRSSLQNLSSPQINAKLCGNFTWYKNQSSTVNPPSAASSDVVEGTEVAITPYISNLNVTIYNQGGHQQYEAANGLYQNDVNNEIVFSEFGIPLVTSFQDSVNDMLKYAKYSITKILGLFDNKPINQDIYDTSTFVYGNVNINPYVTVSELGGNAWVNTPVWFIRTDGAGSMTYGATWKTGTEDPALVAGGVSYPNNKLIGPVFNDISASYANPFCIFRRFSSLRNSDNSTVTYGVVNSDGGPGTGVTISKPYCDFLGTFLSQPFSTDRIGGVTIVFNHTKFNIMGSTIQNSTNWNLSLVNMSVPIDPNVSEYRDKLDFNTFYTSNSMPKYAIIVNNNTDGLYSELLTNNADNETLSAMVDDNYVFLASYFSKSSTKNHLLILFTNYAYIQILHFILDDALAGGVLPAVHEIKQVELPPDPNSMHQRKKFAYYANDWTLETYLEYMQELQHVTVPNAPLFILPKFTDGTNGALLFDLDDAEDVYPQFIWSTDPTIQENIFYMNNTLYTIWRQNGTTKISGCGPCCAINDPTEAVLNVDDAAAFNTHFYYWWYQRLTVKPEYWRDITTYVNDYNLAFPIVNALDTHTYANESIALDNETPELANDDITWLIDATGAQVYIKDQTFENIYSFAQSALSVNFTYNAPGSSSLSYTMTPAIPTVGEPSSISDTTYSFINAHHIRETTANPYYYAADSTLSFINNAFTVDSDGNITFPCIPVTTSDGTSSGLLTFFVKFETDPAVFTFDPNIKQSSRFANMYNFCKQFINKTPSLYNDKYPFDAYVFYNNETLYENIAAYLTLKNRDLTLKLKCPNYPSIDNIVFHLNETSMVDFKSCVVPRGTDKMILQIIDADNQVLTPELAKKIYSNINVCVDWEYSN